MNWLKNLKLFAAMTFICGILLSVTAASCDSKASEDNATEEAESNEHPKEDAEHPAGEHPKSDSTEVEDNKQ